MISNVSFPRAMGMLMPRMANTLYVHWPVNISTYCS